MLQRFFYIVLLAMVIVCGLLPHSSKGVLMHSTTDHDTHAHQRAAALQRFFFNERVAFARIVSNAGKKKEYPHPLIDGIDIDAALLVHVAGDAVPPVPYTYIDSRGNVISKCGHITLATYAPCPGTNLTRVAMIDFDGGIDHPASLADPTHSMRIVYQHLSAQGVHAFPERSKSGMGWHLWVFANPPCQASVIQALLFSVIDPHEHSLLDGSLADPHESKGVEVFPKVISVAPDGWGSPMFLPWRHTAQPGCCEFYRINADGEFEHDPLPDFQIIPPLVLQHFAASLAEARTSTIARTTAQSVSITTTSPISGAATDSSCWWDEVRSRLPLEAVYGPWLTGKINAKGWLECRDPKSSSGDQNPSAGVMSRGGARGEFKSFLRAATLDPAEFLVETGQCPTYPAACAHLAALTGVPLPSSTPPRQAAPTATVSIEEPSPDPEIMLLPLLEARTQLTQVGEKIAAGLRYGEPGITLVQAGVGVGKTTVFADLFRRIASGSLRTDGGGPLRVLWLTPTRQTRDEFVASYCETPAGALIPGIGIHAPRSNEPTDPGYCSEFQRACSLAAKRHIVPATLCVTCAQSKQCPYWRNWHELGNALGVVATHQAFLHAGDTLRPFDLVIIDEGIEYLLYERIQIEHHDIDLWGMQARQDTVYWPLFHPILETLAKAFAAQGVHGLVVHRDGSPLISILRQLNPDIDEQLQSLAAEFPACLQSQTRTATCERPRQNGAIPLRALSELIPALADEAAIGIPQYPQTWLLPASSGKQSSMLLYQVRHALLARLASLRTIILDATPLRPLLDLLLAGAYEDVTIQPEAFTHVTLFTDGLFQRGSTTETWLRRAGEHAVKLLCQQYTKPLVVCHKDACAALVLPDHAQLTHYGAADTRGTNCYTDCDAIIMLGHYRTPDGETVRAASAATRAREGTAVLPAPDDFDPHARIKVSIPILGQRDADGRPRTVAIGYPAEPFATALGRVKYSAELWQIIGRARPSDPARADAPLHVYLFIGEPIAGLPVDTLTTVKDWLEQYDPQWLDANPPPTRFGGRFTEKNRRDMWLSNLSRQLDADMRISQAIEQLHTEGAKLSRQAIAERAGASSNTVRRYHERREQLFSAIHQAEFYKSYLKDIGLMVFWDDNILSDCMRRHALSPALQRVISSLVEEAQILQLFNEVITAQPHLRQWAEEMVTPLVQQANCWANQQIMRFQERALTVLKPLCLLSLDDQAKLKYLATRWTQAPQASRHSRPCQDK
jgi:hypothetical protein